MSFFVRPLALLPALLVLAACGSSTPSTPALVFLSSRDGDYALFGGAADGGHQRRLTKGEGDPATPKGLFFQTPPARSPTGQRIAFHSNARGGHYEIYSIGVDGTGLRRETRSAIDTIEPAWSPDGKEIAFSRDGAIWEVDRAGNARQITSAQNDSSPAWRPRGRIAPRP